MKTHLPTGRWAAVLVVAVLMLGSAWLWHARAATPAEVVPPVSALVQVKPLTTQVMPETVSALAEVIAGPPRGMNFVQAGKIAQLPVVAGQTVRQGSLLATLDVDPTAALALVQAQDAARLTEAEWQRLVGLKQLRLATESQVDAAAKARQDAIAGLAAQRALGAGETSSSLRAPFDGIVLSVAAAQGDRVAAGTPIVQLVPRQALKVRIGIEPVDARRVTVGTRVSLVSLDRPDAPLETAVTEVQAVVDAKTQLIDVIADLPSSASARVVSGMRMRASLVLSRRPAQVVPRSAVLSDERGDYLFQVDGSTARRAKVTRGLESAGLVEVMGADPGKPVVTVGNYELEDGMPVRIQPP